MEASEASKTLMYNNVLHDDMKIVDLKPKKIGNSIGFIIPADVVEEEDIRVGKTLRVCFFGSRMDGIRKLVGTIPHKESTDKAMEVIDRGWRD